MVKVFIKPDPGLSLRTHHRRMKGKREISCLLIFVSHTYFALVDREALADISNVYNYQAFVETDKAGYIIRQWLASNLYDRIRFVCGPHIHFSLAYS